MSSKLIPYFKKGSLLFIKLTLSNNVEQNITGICIKKRNKGFNTSIVVKHFINNFYVLQKIPLYSPFIKHIQVLEL